MESVNQLKTDELRTLQDKVHALESRVNNLTAERELQEQDITLTKQEMFRHLDSKRISFWLLRQLKLMTKRQIKGEDTIDTGETSPKGVFMTESKSGPVQLKNIDTSDPDLMSLL